MVKSIMYFAEKEFATQIFESCKNVYSPSFGGPALGAMCGSWGAEFCTPERLFEYCGNVANPYVPFEIKYDYGPMVPEGMKLYNAKIIPCNESVDVSTMILALFEFWGDEIKLFS
jgi:hypothetical protein